MAYDEDLADRVRAVLPQGDRVTERQMFGGLAFMLGGHMFCGVVKDTLMVRLGPESTARALEQPHVRPMDFTGRPMKGMVFVESAGLHGAALRQWVDAAASHVRRLPPKPPRRLPVVGITEVVAAVGHSPVIGVLPGVVRHSIVARDVHYGLAVLGLDRAQRSPQSRH